MYVEMNYEMFAERLNTFTDMQKQALWKYYKEIETKSESAKLIFSAEIIQDDWYAYGKFEEFCDQFGTAMYPVMAWAKEFEADIIHGKAPAYHDCLVGKIKEEYGDQVLVLDDDSVLVMKG